MSLETSLFVRKIFSSNFTNNVKNYPLARKVMDLIEPSQLIEMIGYNRTEVTLLMNACNALLVTSKNESGPLVVKEAMACGCPLVSTDVGDVKYVIGETEGCFVTTFEPEDIAEKLNMAISIGRCNGRERIIKLGLDIEKVAENIISVYQRVLDVA